LVSEDTQWKPKENHSAYSISKFHSEMEAWRGIAEGLQVIIVNPSVIIGPGNWKKGSPSFFNTINKGLMFYTSGVTGFVDVRDVVNIMIRLIRSDISNQRFILSSENMSYRDFFNLIADTLQKPHPGIEAKPFMTSLACKYETIKYLIFRIPPLITNETMSAAYHKEYYSNIKISDQLNYGFIPINKSINDTADIFKNRSKYLCSNYN
jgi:nucleoside-diphosphate-sugar epimerase